MQMIQQRAELRHRRQRIVDVARQKRDRQPAVDATARPRGKRRRQPFQRAILTRAAGTAFARVAAHHQGVIIDDHLPGAVAEAG